jgi:transposase
VVLLVSEQLRAGQIRGLEQHLAKRIRELEAWKERLAKPGSGPRTKKSAQKQVAALCSGQYVKDVLRVTYDEKRKGADRLEYSIDESAKLHLETEVFGKRILMTNRSAWDTKDVILAYRGQSEVEAVFRQTKDDEHMAVRPQYHWTDHKVHVHTFICLLALLLGRVIEHEARKLGRSEGLSTLLDELGRVRLAMLLLPSGEKGGRPRAEWQLEEAEGETLELLRAVVPDKRPFVYTPASR